MWKYAHAYIYTNGIYVSVYQYMLRIVLWDEAWIFQWAILKLNFPEGLFRKSYLQNPENVLQTVWIISIYKH